LCNHLPGQHLSSDQVRLLCCKGQRVDCPSALRGGRGGGDQLILGPRSLGLSRAKRGHFERLQLCLWPIVCRQKAILWARGIRAARFGVGGRPFAPPPIKWWRHWTRAEKARRHRAVCSPSRIRPLSSARPPHSETGSCAARILVSRPSCRQSSAQCRGAAEDSHTNKQTSQCEQPFVSLVRASGQHTNGNKRTQMHTVCARRLALCRLALCSSSTLLPLIELWRPLKSFIVSQFAAHSSPLLLRHFQSVSFWASGERPMEKMADGENGQWGIENGE